MPVQSLQQFIRIRGLETKGTATGLCLSEKKKKEVAIVINTTLKDDKC